MCGQQYRSVVLWRERDFRNRFVLRESLKSGQPEINDRQTALLFLKLFQMLPGWFESCSVNRIVILCLSQDDARVGCDFSSRPIESAEALTQGIQRGKFGDERVKINVDAGLDTLCGNDNERSFERARRPCPNRFERLYDGVPIHRPCWPDQQHDLAECWVQFGPQLFEYPTRTCHTVENHTDGGLLKPPFFEVAARLSHLFYNAAKRVNLIRTILIRLFQSCFRFSERNQPRWF